MLTLPRNKRGAKRMRPRVEELIKISIQSIVTNKPSARHQIIDGKGNWFEFVDEVVGNDQRLKIYINGHDSRISFRLVDDQIKGRIKNQIPCDGDRVYYVVVGGKRYRALYIDPQNRKIGSRESLNAIYTSESISRKQRQFWRDLQRLKRNCGSCTYTNSRHE